MWRSGRAHQQQRVKPFNRFFRSGDWRSRRRKYWILLDFYWISRCMFHPFQRTSMGLWMANGSSALDEMVVPSRLLSRASSSAIHSAGGAPSRPSQSQAESTRVESCNNEWRSTWRIEGPGGTNGTPSSSSNNKISPSTTLLYCESPPDQESQTGR